MPLDREKCNASELCRPVEFQSVFILRNAVLNAIFGHFVAVAQKRK